MPVIYDIDTHRRLVTSTWSGMVTLAEARAHNDALRSDPDFNPSMRQLSDARRAQSAVSVADLRLLAGESPFGSGSRRAVVGASDLVYGVSRMYQALTDTNSATVRVFRDIDEAREWLESDQADE